MLLFNFRARFCFWINIDFTKWLSRCRKQIIFHLENSASFENGKKFTIFPHLLNLVLVFRSVNISLICAIEGENVARFIMKNFTSTYMQTFSYLLSGTMASADRSWGKILLCEKNSFEGNEKILKNSSHEDAFAYLITMEMQIRWFEFDSSSSYILLNTNHERV